MARPAGKRKRTATIVDQQLNPRPIKNAKVKHDSIEDDPLSLVINSVYRREFLETGILDQENWLAVVLRVDHHRASVISVKARIPEIDGLLPEPPEWVSPETESCSHFLIDAHRTFVGTMSVIPQIGQIIRVTVPLDYSFEKDGEIIGVTGQFTTPGSIKSSELEEGAKSSVEDASAIQQTSDINLTDNDTSLGTSVRSDASQVVGFA